MQVSVVPHHHTVGSRSIQEQNTVVIDMFRATSVIVTALAHGVKKVFVTNEIDRAIQLANHLGRTECILGGERASHKIPGFDFGNSPQSYANRDIVLDKNLILTTTNGTKAIEATRMSKKTFISSFLNNEFIAQKLMHEAKDVLIVCAGSCGNFAIEDGICAGMLLSEMDVYGEYGTDDFGYALKSLYLQNIDNIEALLSSTKGYSGLKKHGYLDDIIFCLQKNIYTIAPYFANGLMSTSYI